VSFRIRLGAVIRSNITNANSTDETDPEVIRIHGRLEARKAVLAEGAASRPPSCRCLAHVFVEKFDHRFGMLTEEILTLEAAGIVVFNPMELLFRLAAFSKAIRNQKTQDHDCRG
jgi:hypothetical protein